MDWRYEKLDEKGDIIDLPIDDKDGSITGKIVLNVPAYFDENPAERIRLGWTKHIVHTVKELIPEYNEQTQFVVRSQKQIDAYTVEDEFHVLDKSEDQLAFEEMLSVASTGGFVFI